ncbi:Uncharacterized protein OBRU01_13407 [Operophtera brumata]|uniref:Tumor suppressor p53-binding protein 1 n=1 Tax=Operophtera brumata TaxID=104452 RepID=A0A0L7L8X6_OPEBR|nr:Uncharacterized protein OBRU01_13407 [Operophtera brumata]
MDSFNENPSEMDSTSQNTDEDQQPVQPKRKLSDTASETSAKIQKLDLPEHETVSSQTLDDEVSEINAGKRKLEDLVLPSTSRVLTPVRSSPRKLKRSNSAEITELKTPKTPKSRPASVDIYNRKTPRKTPAKQTDEVVVIKSDKPSIPKVEFVKQISSRPSVEFVKEIRPPKVSETIAEENSELYESQEIHLALSPSPDDDVKIIGSVSVNHSSDPVTVKDRREILDPGKVSQTRSDGYNYSDQSNLSQPIPKGFGNTTDQESTDSFCSMNLESPDHVPSVASKMISKLSNGNSSTPTEIAEASKVLAEDSDNTPDTVKLHSGKGKRGKIDAFRTSNTTTPSTISPMQNGHSLPISTPQIPVFDIHVNYNEDNEFLSLYIVKTDNDIGLDICREYQRISKRFTVDPYLADASVSPSSVASSSVSACSMVNLPNRTSFASTVSSSTSTSSNRTSDGNFVVPQPPRKSVTNPSTSVKGYDNLIEKLNDIFHHVRETTIDERNRSLNEEKSSIGIQVCLSSDGATTNGNASPEEVNKCDKNTPKSSLKKSRVRGRRQIAGKTKRAILPTQAEEPEYMHGMNSPEMIPTNGENGKASPVSPKDEKSLLNLVATPKSVNKLKQKRRPTSPRPATPVDTPKAVKTEYPGYAPDTVVLAKWVDRRYYSGKTLPLKGQSVYAVVDEEQNYEPGLVMGVEENESLKSAKTAAGRPRLASESSSVSESSNSAPPRIEEVAGVEPEVQRTPRKLDGVKAGPLQLKGAAKQNIGKKNSKLNKFENDEDTVSVLGPIPRDNNKIFAGLHFLLTCTDTPKRQTAKSEKNGKTDKETRHYSSEEDSEANSVVGTDTEDLVFCSRPFNKERLKEQLEAGGGTVHSCTAKYICCLAADIRAVSHEWVIVGCAGSALVDEDAYALPAGYSILKAVYISWVPPTGRRNANFFKDKVILFCGDQDTVKFWEGVCTLAGANTRVVNEEDLNMTGAIALVTEWDCPHEVQNKAVQDNVPLVATTWIVQCLIESRVIPPTSHVKFSFSYTEPE